MEHYPTAAVNNQATGQYFLREYVALDLSTRLKAFSSTLCAVIWVISSSTWLSPLLSASADPSLWFRVSRYLTSLEPLLYLHNIRLSSFQAPSIQSLHSRIFTLVFAGNLVKAHFFETPSWWIQCIYAYLYLLPQTKILFLLLHAHSDLVPTITG